MNNTNMPSLTHEEIQFLQITLRNHLAKYGVCASFFGSRTRTDYRLNSDLDILIEASSTIPLECFAFLKEELENSFLPFVVDIVDSSKINTEFLAKIRNNCIKFNLE